MTAMGKCQNWINKPWLSHGERNKAMTCPHVPWDLYVYFFTNSCPESPRPSQHIPLGSPVNISVINVFKLQLPMVHSVSQKLVPPG